MKVAFFETANWQKKLFKRELKGFSLQFFKEPISKGHLKKIKDVEALALFLNSKITEDYLKKLPKLKIIITMSTGYDHINLKSCKKRKIIVCNRPEYGDNTVAEHTFALILAISRKVHKSYLRNLSEDFSIEGLKGFDLENKTLGVLGTGRIGKHVIRIARGFNMKILATAHSEDEFLSEQFNFKYVSFKELLKKSDILTIHIPYSKENHHLFNKKTFSQMKKGAILINTARGPIVDTEALIKALDSKQISATGLDVLEGEQLIKEEQFLTDPLTREDLKQIAEDEKLISMENVVYTPHIAFYSQEALERIVKNTIENLKEFKSNNLDKTCVVY